MGLVVLTFTSCEKDSTSDPKVESIVGLWTISESSFDATINDVDMIPYIMDAFGVTQELAETFTQEYFQEITGTANFKEDGNYTMATNSKTNTGTYKLNADNTKVTMDEGTADEMILDIVSLSSSKLELSFTETEVKDIDNDSFDDTIIVIITLVCTK